MSKAARACAAGAGQRGGGRGACASDAGRASRAAGKAASGCASGAGLRGGGRGERASDAGCASRTASETASGAGLRGGGRGERASDARRASGCGAARASAAAGRCARGCPSGAWGGSCASRAGGRGRGADRGGGGVCGGEGGEVGAAHTPQHVIQGICDKQATGAPVQHPPQASQQRPAAKAIRKPRHWGACKGGHAVPAKGAHAPQQVAAAVRNVEPAASRVQRQLHWGLEAGCRAHGAVAAARHAVGPRHCIKCAGCQHADGVPPRVGNKERASGGIYCQALGAAQRRHGRGCPIQPTAHTSACQCACRAARAHAANVVASLCHVHPTGRVGSQSPGRGEARCAASGVHVASACRARQHAGNACEGHCANLLPSRLCHVHCAATCAHSHPSGGVEGGSGSCAINGEGDIVAR